MIQQAYKYDSSSLWSHLAFFELKITNILKSSEWGLEESELACVSYRTTSLPSFNGLHCKLAKITLLFYILEIILG